MNHSKMEPTPELLMAYLDGELPPEEAERFARLLEEHPEWRQQAAEMGALIEATKQLAFRPPNPEIWDNYWEEIDARLNKPIGWIVLAIGGLLLVIAGTVKVILLAQDPFVRVGLFSVIIGFLILFVGVLRGHLLERAKDRYRKIKR